MINWIKANSKSSNFQGIILLPASCYFLYTMPVLRGENRIIVRIECWPYNKQGRVKKMTEEENYSMFKISRKWTHRPEKAFLWSICMCILMGKLWLSWHQIMPGNEKKNQNAKASRWIYLCKWYSDLYSDVLFNSCIHILKELFWKTEQKAKNNETSERSIMWHKA